MRTTVYHSPTECLNPSVAALGRLDVLTRDPRDAEVLCITNRDYDRSTAFIEVKTMACHHHTGIHLVTSVGHISSARLCLFAKAGFSLFCKFLGTVYLKIEMRTAPPMPPIVT